MTNNSKDDVIENNSIYSETTVELIKTRRNMKIKNKEDENKKAELNKLINKRVRKEKREKNMKKIEEAIIEGKGLKRARNTEHRQTAIASTKRHTWQDNFM